MEWRVRAPTRLSNHSYTQWRRSCGGPGVRTSPLFGSVGVHMYLDPHPTFTAVQRLRTGCGLTSYCYWSCYVTIWIIISSGTTLRPASLHARSICHWLVSSYLFPGTRIYALTAVGAAAVPHLAVYTPVAAVTVIWRWASAFANDGHYSCKK